MSRLAAWIRGVSLTLGAPGLFVVAFLDSSFLSLPEVVDILVVYMVAQHPARVVLYVAGATAGSLVGCLVMFVIGKKGGEALIRRHFAESSIDRVMRFFQQYGTVTVLIPCLLPPPMPFKIFVIAAGVAEISVHRFVIAIVIGRGARYAALGLLAVRYGQPAMAYMRDNGAFVSLVAAGVLLAAFVAYVFATKASRLKHR